MKKLSLILALAVITCGARADEQAPEQRLLKLDEGVWIAFYDLPSRRFRSIRDAFVRRNFDAVSRDLEITVGFLRIETDRAVPELAPVMNDVANSLEAIASQLPATTVTVSSLDAIFARTHWLLSQHYFTLALESRESEMHRNAGRYLNATAHHLERAVLWSDARISSDVVKSLESIRDMSARLENSDRPERVYRDRPLRLTARTLTAIGEHLDRRVWIEDSLPQ